LLVPVSVAVKVGVDPDTVLPKASLRRMVTAEVADPSATTGELPVIVEFAALAAPAINVTGEPIFATGVTIESDFISATVDLSEQVETPEAFETEQDP
jgi:hypothetical protein